MFEEFDTNLTDIEIVSEGLKYKVASVEVSNVTNSPKKGHLVIPQEVSVDGDSSSSNEDGKKVAIPVTRIAKLAFLDCMELVSVQIPEGITSIGEGAFLRCSSLESVEMPESVNFISRAAFADCERLVTIKLPEVMKEIEGEAFSRCKALTSIIIPDGVTHIQRGVFDCCEKLVSVELSASLIQIGDWAFHHCISLSEISIPESVKVIGEWAFYDCSNLTSILLPPQLEEIHEGAFCDCRLLESITIPSKVSFIKGIFGGCDNLKSLVVEEGNVRYDSREGCNAIIKTQSNTLIAGCAASFIPESVTSIGGSAFLGCTGLKTLTVPDAVKKIGYRAFWDCRGLEYLSIPEHLEGSFFNSQSCTLLGCVNLKTVVVRCQDGTQREEPNRYYHPTK